jgi:hypothetical protein
MRSFGNEIFNFVKNIISFAPYIKQPLKRNPEINI